MICCRSGQGHAASSRSPVRPECRRALPVEENHCTRGSLTAFPPVTICLLSAIVEGSAHDTYHRTWVLSSKNRRCFGKFSDGSGLKARGPAVGPFRSESRHS